jgi:BlaI family penicillinase repressor
MPKTPRISEAEWVVMRLLWEESPRTANEVVDAVAGAQQWQARTVKTLLGRLVRKGALRFRAEGRTYRYYPAVSEKNCIRAESRSFIDRVFGGALTPMLAEFIEAAPLTPREIEELKRLLEKKESDHE